jgi:hypothetical protein
MGMAKYICEKCKKLFNYKHLYTSHIQSCTEQVDLLMGNKYIMKCSFKSCKSEFTSENAFSQHLTQYHSQQNNNDKKYHSSQNNRSTSILKKPRADFSKSNTIVNNINIIRNNICVERPIPYKIQEKIENQPIYISKSIRLYNFQGILTDFMPYAIIKFQKENKWFHCYPCKK